MTNRIAHALETRAAASFCAAALGFIILRLYFDITVVLAAAAAVCTLLIVLNFSGRISNLILLLISAAVFLGVFSASDKIAKNEAVIAHLDAKTVRMTGSVVSFPTKAGGSLKFYFKTDSIFYSGGKYKNNFKIYVTCDDCNIEYGDVLTMNAKLVYPKSGGYDMSGYILSKGAPMAGYCEELLRVEEGGFLRGAVGRIRNYLLQASEGLHGDAKGLFCALTAGDKSHISSKGRGEFSSSGIAHIACVSGLHISIIGMAIYRILSRINKYLGAAMSVSAVFIFAAVSGCTPSSLRAAVMYTLFIISEVCIRQNDSLTSLLLSALLIALNNPYAVFDMGFILSYLSVLGMQLFSRRVKEALCFLPKTAADSAAVTVSAQMLTTPIILVCFNTLSVYSVFANIIVSFIFPPALYVCFTAAACACIPILSGITNAVCQLLLDSLCAAAHLFASLPFGSAGTDKFGAAMILCYAVIVLLFVFSEKLSEIVLGAGVIGCALVLTAVSLGGGNHSTYLSDNSALISSGRVTAAVIYGDLESASSHLLSAPSPSADVVLIGDCGKITAEELTDILSITGAECVCLPQGADSYAAMAQAMKRGAKVVFYPDTVTDLSAYAEAKFL